MAVERESRSQEDFGTLEGCFVEGSAEQRARERRIRRRALIISIAVQSAILAVIVLIPLFGKPQRIAFANMIPIPPYYPSNAPERTNSQPVPPNHRHFTNPCLMCPPVRIPDHVSTNDDPTPPEIIPGTGPGDGTREGPCPGCFPMDDGRRQPERPAEVRPQTPPRLFRTHLEPAMLIQRVEPVYPLLARQVHREGRVELHAIIASDGTIQSLQVVSGDAFFLQSALDAVRQWRYRATVLNGQPVEIDTYITVVYTFEH